MSYEQYKILLEKMTEQELADEIAKLRNKMAATVGKTRDAWKQMHGSAVAQQERNAARR